jgi:hypothetical protein
VATAAATISTDKLSMRFMPHFNGLVRYMRYTSVTETRVKNISTVLMMLTLAVAGSAVLAQEKFESSPDARVPGGLQGAVEKYEQLRKKADDSAPPLKKSSDPAKIKDAQQASPSGSVRPAPA